MKSGLEESRLGRGAWCSQGRRGSSRHQARRAGCPTCRMHRGV